MVLWGGVFVNHSLVVLAAATPPWPSHWNSTLPKQHLNTHSEEESWKHFRKEEWNNEFLVVSPCKGDYYKLMSARPRRSATFSFHFNFSFTKNIWNHYLLISSKIEKPGEILPKSHCIWSDLCMFSFALLSFLTNLQGYHPSIHPLLQCTLPNALSVLMYNSNCGQSQCWHPSQQFPQLPQCSFQPQWPLVREKWKQPGQHPPTDIKSDPYWVTNLRSQCPQPSREVHLSLSLSVLSQPGLVM